MLPLTFDLAVWHGHVTLLVLLVVGGLAGWGFWVALAGRPLFRDEIQGSAQGWPANAPDGASRFEDCWAERIGPRVPRY